MVAVVAGASYRAGGAASASRIITTEAGSARNLLPNPEAPSGPGEIPPAFARGLQQPPEIIPAPGGPFGLTPRQGPPPSASKSEVLGAGQGLEGLRP